MNKDKAFLSGRRQNYVSPSTAHISIEIEGGGILASSKDAVVTTNTEITIDRQGDSGLGSKLDGGNNIVNNSSFSITWE